MLTEKQKTKLKKMLIEQKHSAEDIISEDDLLDKGSLRDSVDELSTIDNHPADLATELFEREKDMALKVHNNDELAKVEAALEAMENGTYGVCVKCGTEIPYDRLAALPYTLFCIEHTDAKGVPTDRPVEEQVILPPVDNSFAGRDDKDDIHDYEDTFQIVAKYGTSETPSDFEGDFDDYNELYDDPEEMGMDEEIESLPISEIDELTGQISRKEIEQARKDDYTE
ncbi:molecular chaperone DnaK [Lysinibacillus odysseyi 34hs-1 = NBRC 100172]|uniref:Molecular chaperone DnaK n=1 Tax=Lysinibacillus odysseyi 34hs-1 = NBRC 100172 TaxID=1220589 RepID=A0A0A3ITM6_9BACI|nr:TraR/DksA C4-type zinc finger protein [Lysinibacillus odysseyi]KGR86770.1 molecular chaperone DnaK [Lysinibacillus odysseyi 34hs-1 = NBRC 100172]